MTLKDLSINHDYYCSDSNFYSNESKEVFMNWDDFYSEYSTADIDLNLVYRWGIEQSNDRYSLKCVFIQQRKGIYHPVIVYNLEEKDVPSIVNFLVPHLNKLLKIWNPLSQNLQIINSNA